MQDENEAETDKETLKPSSNMELTVMTPSRYKRRHSMQNTKIFVKSSEEESFKILPGVLLTFNEKFIKIGENPAEPVKEQSRVIVFRERSDSMKSIDI